MAADLRIARKGAGKIGPARGDPRRAARHRRHAAPGAARQQDAGDRADGDRRRSSTSRRRSELGIVNQVWETATAQEFLDKIQAYAEGFCPPNKASQGGRAASSARCSRAPRCRSRARSPSSASCSSSSSRARTPRKGWRPTSRSARASSPASRSLRHDSKRPRDPSRSRGRWVYSARDNGGAAGRRAAFSPRPLPWRYRATPAQSSSRASPSGATDSARRPSPR